MKRVLHTLNSALSRPTSSLTRTAGLVAIGWGIALLLWSIYPYWFAGTNNGLIALWGAVSILTGTGQLAAVGAAKVKITAELIANYFGVGVWAFLGSLAYGGEMSPFIMVSAAVAGVLLVASCVSIIRINWQRSIATLESPLYPRVG